MSKLSIRRLETGDETALERYLETRPDTTMILRSNLRRVGLRDGGRFAEGSYAAVWQEDRIVGAAAHYWNGNVVVDCPDRTAEVVRLALSAPGREISGVLGPWAQVEETLLLPGFDRPRRSCAREDLLALDLEHLRIPPALESQTILGRHPTDEELDSTLSDWRLAYEVEELGGGPSEERRATGRELLSRLHSFRNLWVAEREGELVSMSGFNATLPDCVQVGSVFTPPPHRGHGFARAVVATSLLEAHAAGARRSVLFVGEDNHAAQRCYRSLGYRRVGDYGLVVFEPSSRRPP